jgi:hypothetical protein
MKTYRRNPKHTENSDVRSQRRKAEQEEASEEPPQEDSD